MAIFKPSSRYTSDELDSDLQRLFDLVDTTVGFLLEIDRLKLDCAERNRIDRVASVAWITRD
jgi:hypothetical protein